MALRHNEILGIENYSVSCAIAAYLSMPALPSFRNPDLLRQALTHSSFAHENAREADNERLEFLGDALLTFLCGEFLYHHEPELSEGDMTRLRTAMVDREQLAEFAIALGIDEQLRLGKSAEQNGARFNPRLLCGAFEAMLGAYYLDSYDLEIVQDFITPLFERIFAELLNPQQNGMDSKKTDHKSLLQQHALADSDRNPQRDPPRYYTERIGGTDDAPYFEAEVAIDGVVYGKGQGRSKKEAEKAAAKAALAEFIAEDA
jgi:ribonuclease-3